jgi:heme-degrading monooxygenase HmoA
MIVREWRARTTRARAAEYPRHFRKVVIPKLRKIPGFLGALLIKRQGGEWVEFVVLTRWSSMEAIRAFAGTDPQKASLEPGARDALTEFDHTVKHYEVLEETVPE